MLEFLAITAAVGLVVLGLLATAIWLLVRHVRRSRLIVAAQALATGVVALLVAFRPSSVRNSAAAVRVLRLTSAQRTLRRRVAEAARINAYLGDIPAMLPRLQAETDRIRTALGRLQGAATPASRNVLAAADRHLATLTDLNDAVAATLVLPAAEGTLARDAEEAARGLRLYAAAYAELTGTPTSADVPVAA